MSERTVILLILNFDKLSRCVLISKIMAETIETECVNLNLKDGKWTW